jgi:twitching motility protein PilT
VPSIDQLLTLALEEGASDVHLRPGRPPVLRIDGTLHVTAFDELNQSDVEGYLDVMIPDRLRVEFKATHEADFAYSPNGKGRFRVNAYRQRGKVTIALRSVAPPRQSFRELGLPPVLERLVHEPRGLILVTGPTGSGKTTTLGAMVDEINRTRRVNIITIEDPIEIVHPDKEALVSQREVGTDTEGFPEAMRRVLRQDPDVILIGEMRDAATIDAALKAAETGHLVLSSLHTLDAPETINRILDFFPAGLQRQVRLLLAGSLRGIVSQRLIPQADGAGRVPIVEVLINTERVAERISDANRTHELPEVIEQGDFYGMETFDQAILRLLAAGTITVEDAFRAATKPSDLRVRAQQAGVLPT